MRDGAFDLIPATDADFGFLWRLHKSAFAEHVEATWGWDEAWQLNYFEKKFEPAEIRLIIVDSETVGAVSYSKEEDQVLLSYIAILPERQNRGIGRSVLKWLLEREGKAMPVSLRVLKVSPARRLYETLGFEVVGENETHFNMFRAP